MSGPAGDGRALRATARLPVDGLPSRPFGQMRFRSSKTIESFSSEAWDSLAAGSFDLRHGYLRFLERAYIGYRALYVLVEDDAGPLALFAARQPPEKILP